MNIEHRTPNIERRIATSRFAICTWTLIIRWGVWTFHFSDQTVLLLQSGIGRHLFLNNLQTLFDAHFYGIEYRNVPFRIDCCHHYSNHSNCPLHNMFWNRWLFTAVSRLWAYWKGHTVYRGKFQKPASLDKIAESVHLSKFHFDRIFKRWVGINREIFPKKKARSR